MLYKIQSEESDGTNLDAAAPVQTSPAIGLTCAPLEDGRNIRLDLMRNAHRGPGLENDVMAVWATAVATCPHRPKAAVWYAVKI